MSQKISSHLSWGRVFRPVQSVVKLDWRDHRAENSFPARGTILPYGLGRSYGDSCLNEGGALVDATGLDRFLAFDRETGVLRCEAGVSLAAVLERSVPAGFFLPVTPGTKYVTIGGAIANDVHGKNHHGAGTFGRHVRCFELLRSNGERLVCSPSQNSELFQATIGGLGLTGLITWAEIQLAAIPSGFIAEEAIRFENTHEFFDIARDSDASYEFTVAWVDTLARGPALGRGIFYRGNWVPSTQAPSGDRSSPLRGPLVNVFREAPEVLLNPLSMQIFNTLFYRKMLQKTVRRIVHYEPFFYPLDAIGQWNLLYGRRGFFQYQVVMEDRDGSHIKQVLELVTAARMSSFLAVLKTFGSLRSPGLLSFPREGVTLTLDFANHGDKTRVFLAELEELVKRLGGRAYPAKDAVMSPAFFKASYEQAAELARFADPRFMSSFWRRVYQAG